LAKSVTFLKLHDKSDGWFETMGRRCLGLDADRVVIDRVEPEPEGLPYRPASASGVAADYDAIVSLTGPAPVVEAVDWTGMLDDAVAAAHGYAVEETQIFDRGAARGLGRTPGTKLFGLLLFHPDLPDSAARRSWALHAGLAERVHVGAARYAQNWIVRPLSSDAPPAHGMPEMHFPTPTDLIERFFDSDRGRDEILQDTAHFVARGPRLYCAEHVLRM
jgi:hypothetical protein